MKAIWIIMLFMALLCIADSVTTAYGISRGHKEGNPFAAKIMERSIILTYALEIVFLVILGFGMNEIFKLNNKTLTKIMIILWAIAMIPKTLAVINNLMVI
jgi:ABC-type iron transport system FetAB permease component